MFNQNLDMLELQRMLFVKEEEVMDLSSLPIYDKINVDWDSPPIYNVYYDDELDEKVVTTTMKN